MFVAIGESAMSIVSRSCFVGLFVLSFASLGVGGCKKKVPESAPEPVASASAPAASYSAGDKVDVNWNGAWWKGEVLATDGAKFKIHYVGWGSNWDESVPAERLRAQTADSKVGAEATAAASVVPPTPVPAETAKVAAARVFKVGDKVDVNWKGAWYQGQVIGTPGGQFRVHYTGFAASWDENVPSSRLRAFSGTAKKGTGPA